MVDSTAAVPVNLYETKGPVVSSIAITFMSLTGIVISLRLYSRLIVVRALGWDDILIFFAAIFSWGFCTTSLLTVKNGLGRHIEAVSAEEFTRYIKIVWFGAMSYNTCLGFIKASVLSLYLRLTPSSSFRCAIFFMMAVITAQSFSNVMTVTFQCRPIRFLWTPDIPGGKCININAFYLANAVLNIFTDFITYTMPMPMLWKLQLPKRQKIGLCGILGLGGFACISSVVRIIYIPAMLKSHDGTWVIAEPVYWSVIETNVGILATSIPSFKILVKKYCPHLLESYSKGSAGQQRRSTTSRSKYGIKGHLGEDRDRSYALRSMENGEAMNTNVTGGEQTGYISTNGSQEQIIPDGKIMKSTHVTMNVEEGVYLCN